MKLGEPEDLALAIGLVLGAGNGTPYDATAIWQSGSQSEQYKISVNPRALYWKSENLRTGEVRSFDPQSMEMHAGSESLRLSLDRVPFSFDVSVRLAFPLSLAIWGRKTDEFGPVALEGNGPEGLILLRHQTDRGLFGSVSFDRETGRMTRLVLPTEVWQINGQR